MPRRRTAARTGTFSPCPSSRIVAGQWGCDVPLAGSQYREPHVDYQRPLFAEMPNLALSPYMLVVSFGLVEITPAHALASVKAGEIPLKPVPLEIVLIRHPWAIHRGTPNTMNTPARPRYQPVCTPITAGK